MKRIALLLSLFAVGLVAASFALAGPPPGKGKDHAKGKPGTTSTTSSENCKPKVSTILKGEFVSAGGDSFAMKVKQANNYGKDYAGKQLTVVVDDKTSYKRNGPAELGDFEAGDSLNVQARTCKARKGAAKDPNAASPVILAKRVTGHPAKADSGDAVGTTTTSSP